MKIDINGRNYKLSPKLKSLIEHKVQKMEKFFDKPVTVKVLCSQEKDRQKMELSLSSGSTFLRSEVETDNMYENLDVCVARMERQIIKYSGKNLAGRNKDLMKELDFFEDIPEFKLPKITKRKVFDLIPMTEEEALKQMDMVGNDFFIFDNSDKKTICLLYKRADGDIGIIETK